jgi:hypothetical protein
MQWKMRRTWKLWLALLAVLLLAVAISDAQEDEGACIAMARDSPDLSVMLYDAPGGEAVAVLHAGQPALVREAADVNSETWYRVGTMNQDGDIVADKWVAAGAVNLIGGCPMYQIQFQSKRSETTMNEVMQVAVSVAASLGALVVLVLLYQRLKGSDQGYPMEEILEPLLLEFIDRAIFAAYEIGDRAIEELGEYMDGADKAAIAASVYRLLPDKIGPFDITVVKQLFPLEAFETLIANRYDAFRRFMLEYEGHFKDAFEQWKNGRESEDAVSALEPAA